MSTPEQAEPARQVVGLFTAAVAGAPMTSHPWVEVVAGSGITGDRYAAGRGHWSDPRWPDQELTLVAAEVAEALAIAPELLRRNVVLRGVALDDLLGVTFRLGEALLFGVRRCDPCRYLDSLTRSGLARSLGDQGGVRARILVGGRIHVGDVPHIRSGSPQPSAPSRTENFHA